MSWSLAGKMFLKSFCPPLYILKWNWLCNTFSAKPLSTWFSLFLALPVQYTMTHTYFHVCLISRNLLCCLKFIAPDWGWKPLLPGSLTYSHISFLGEPQFQHHSEDHAPAPSIGLRHPWHRFYCKTSMGKTQVFVWLIRHCVWLPFSKWCTYSLEHN